MTSGGAGVVGAEVKVNDNSVVYTKADGSFLLDSMKTAVYNIQVSLFSTVSERVIVLFTRRATAKYS